MEQCQRVGNGRLAQPPPPNIFCFSAGINIFIGNLGPRGDYAPVGLIPLLEALPIVDALSAGEELIGTLKVVAIGEERETWNIVAETKGGDPNNVIVVIICVSILPGDIRDCNYFNLTRYYCVIARSPS